MSFVSRGWAVSPFVFVAVALENMALLSIGINLFTYAFNTEHFSLTTSANIVTNFMGTLFLLTLPGGIISDVWWTRFKTILVAGIIETLGFLLLTLTAAMDSLRPPHCESLSASCRKPSSSQKAIFFSGLYLIALGSGGVKGNLAALGADQFNDQDSHLGTYFNGYFFSFILGGTGAVTALVYIQENVSFKVGYLIALCCTALAIMVVLCGYSLYRHNKHDGGSPLVSVAQVFVAAFRNRNLHVSSLHEDKTMSNRIPHSDQFRFLDKAAAGSLTSPWRLCTVTQVEEIKVILRIIPIFASTIVLNCVIAQVQTVSQQQGRTMDRKVGSTFEIPPASLSAIPMIFMLLLLPIYDRALVPLLRRFTGHENGITYLQRISVGLLLAIVSMVAAGLVEKRRLRVAREHELLDKQTAIVPMKIYWILIQYSAIALADMFTFVGLMEFFYRESPERLRSMSTSLSFVSLSMGYFLSSAIVSVVKSVTTRNGSLGWLPDNINRGKLTNFYWLLAGICAVNFGLYLLCAKWYKYRDADIREDKEMSLMSESKQSLRRS